MATGDWDVGLTCEVVGSLGIRLDEARLENAVRRSQRKQASVAVVGLVSRGKSTFVNQLVGQSLCPTAARAETAIVLAVTRGAPCASGVLGSGERVGLPVDPDEFRAAARRAVRADLVEATYSGPVELPEGLLLIDTPGVDEATAGDSNSDLAARWSAAGADAAILVIGVPPGAASTEWRLLDSLTTTFAGAVHVVVKATDPSIGDVELDQVVDYIRETKGVFAHAVGPTEHPDREHLDVVRGWLDNAVASSADGRRIASDEVDAVIADVIADVACVPASRSGVLRAVLSDLSSIEPSVAAAVVERHLDIAVMTQRAEMCRRRALDAERSAVVDASVERLVTRLNGAASSNSAIHRELCELAVEGSMVAIEELRRAGAQNRGGREKLGMSRREVEKFVALLTSSQVRRLCEDTVLGRDWFGALIVCARSRPELAQTLAAAARTVHVETWFDHAIVETFGSVRTMVPADTVVWALTDGLAIQLHRLSQAWMASSDLVDWRLRTLFDIADAFVTMGVVSRAVEEYLWELTHAVANELTARLVRHGALMTAQPREERGEWKRLRREGDSAARWVAQLAPHTPPVGQVGDLFGADGALEEWARESAVAIENAKATSLRGLQQRKNVYGWSFVLWGVSILMLGASAEAAVLIWLVSLVMWFSTRHDHSEPRPWIQSYSAPPIRGSTGQSELVEQMNLLAGRR